MKRPSDMPRPTHEIVSAMAWEAVASKMNPDSHEKWKQAEAAAQERAAAIYGHRECAECGQVFAPNSSNQIVCSAPACRSSRNRRYKQAAKAGLSGRLTKMCPVCGNRLVAECASACKPCRERARIVKHNERIKNDPEYAAQIRAKQDEKNARVRAENYEVEVQRVRLALKNTACPFQDMQTHCECKTWDCAEMDPMTSRAELAVRVNVVEQKQKRKKAA